MSSRMRPDAAMFSPRTSTPSSNGDLAIIPYNSVNGQSDVNNAARKLMNNVLVNGNTNSSMEMIMHESMKKLLAEVSQLKARCDDLETANADLKEAMSAIEQVCAANTSTAKTNGNLPGYVSSDSNSDPKEDRGRSTTPREMNQQFDTIELILKVYKEKIESQSAQQQDLEKRFERKSQDQTILKGRIGSIEKAFKDLKEEYENNDFFSKKPGNSASEIGTYFADELQSQQFRLTDLEINCRKAHNELDRKCEVLTAVVKSSGGPDFPASTSSLWSNETEGKPPKASKQDIVDLKRWQGHMLRQFGNNQIVDEAATRDALYAMFFQLSEIMKKGDGGTVWCEGRFEATSDEAFKLRDRVLCRLALFDHYATALEEAQSKKGQIDW